MKKPLITGTIRGRQGDKHLLIDPKGERHLIKFEGVDAPRIGVDVIGILADSPDGPIMRLVPDVTRMLLSGRARISAAGRPDITARMLARLLTGVAPGSIRPGTGGMIERTPDFADPDIAWAMDLVAGEAKRAGIALNVIDPIAMAGASWDANRLKEEILPADMAGEQDSLTDLQRLLNMGMTPACRRTIERIGRGAAMPSVDFILPYSPFSSGFSWSNDIARAHRNEIVSMGVPLHDARKISTFREIAIAFAPRYLGRMSSARGYESQAEQTFADVSAILALRRLGSPQASSAFKFQRLREAALARWDQQGQAPVASSDALAVALTLPNSDGSADSLFRTAASITRSHAAVNADAFNAVQVTAQERGVYIDLETASEKAVSDMRAIYRADLAEAVASLNGHGLAIDRFSRFGVYTAPLGFEDEFDSLVPAPSDDHVDEAAFSLFDEAMAADPALATSPTPFR